MSSINLKKNTTIITNTLIFNLLGHINMEVNGNERNGKKFVHSATKGLKLQIQTTICSVLGTSAYMCSRHKR